MTGMNIAGYSAPGMEVRGIVISVCVRFDR